MAVKPSSETTGPRTARGQADTGSPLPAIALTGVGVLLIAACAVLLSYNGIYQIALQGGIERRYAHLYPGGFTLLLLMAFGASYLLRAAPRPRRLWADALILALILLAAGASALNATETRVPTGVVVVAVAATPWLALLVAFRVFMWVYTHLRGENEDRATPAPRRGAVAPPPVPAEQPLVEAAKEEADPPAVRTTGPFPNPAVTRERSEDTDTDDGEGEESEDDRRAEAPPTEERRRKPALLWPRAETKDKRPKSGDSAAEASASGPLSGTSPDVVANPAPDTVGDDDVDDDVTVTPVPSVHLLRPVDTPADTPVDAGDRPEAEPAETAEPAAEAASTAEPEPEPTPAADPELVAEPLLPPTPADEEDEWADKAQAIEEIRRAEEAREAERRREDRRAEHGEPTDDSDGEGDTPEDPHDGSDSGGLPKRTPGSGNPIKEAVEVAASGGHPVDLVRGPDDASPADQAVDAPAAEADDSFPHDIIPGDPTSDEAEIVPVHAPDQPDDGGDGDRAPAGASRDAVSEEPQDAPAPAEERDPLEKRPMVLKPRRQPMAAFPFPSDPPSRMVRSEPTPPQD
ncbi:DUF2637 domain-containing protein [Nocardiopsis gilva YIM 90087]|uniref:DUF2637 domain-containing protein n=1 Tax=Nocardiopsis gilva YIM 90087 TaxID=1235441 RepID=A0A223S221_9ACTN|nr:DUF2637 domain-containing protein [Nocardiopsis gilva]ASU82192.1 DUF2637 domain-containing protein [Nocardiopsis gilva YIM 90087]